MDEFGNEVNYEEIEIAERLTKEDAVRQKMQAQQIGQYNQNMIGQGIQEACQEAGISVEDFSRMSGFDLEMTASELKSAAKSMAKNVMKKSKQPGKQVRPGQPGQPVQASSDRRENLRNIDTKRREGRVSSDQALLDSLNSILPPDDEFWKYG